MPPHSRDVRIQLSVLDRLLDDEPRNGQEASVTRSQTLAKLKDALRRDLEWLLNTRASPEEVGEGFEETGSSVFTYGLPDFSALSAGSDQTRARLERVLQRALETFEPRLLHVVVQSVSEDKKSDKRILRFLISGWLRMEPSPLQVSFDTRLDLARGEYRIAED